MFHPKSRTAPSESAELPVAYSSFDDARRAFPHCERSAVRAYARSVASKAANAAVQPTGEIERFGDLIGFFFNIEALAIASLRTRRWDHYAALCRDPEFERRGCAGTGRRGQDQRRGGGVSAPSMATLADMQAWAAALMASRKPDFVIGDDYLRRWFVIPRNPWMNVYLHDIRKSDDDRALHDHPWSNTSFIIAGGYLEYTPEGYSARWAGDVVTREAGQLHRLEVLPGGGAVSLFMTGPKVREWGFACPQGWVNWKDFTSESDSSQTGRGCGEPDDPTPVTRNGFQRGEGLTP